MDHCHVLGSGNGRLNAPIMFVAEAVGRRGGAVTGVPLTRDATGRRFEAFLAIAGIDRRGVFVTNAVICNPRDARGRNRSPRPAEISRCRPYLHRAIDIVAPAIVVALGRVALESLRAIAPHGSDLPRDAATGLPWHGRVIVPMYHPGVQSTLHRPHDRQVDDWRRLGALCSGTLAPYHEGG